MAGRNVFIRQNNSDLDFAGEFVGNLLYLIESNKAAFIIDMVNSIKPILTDTVNSIENACHAMLKMHVI